MTFQIERKNCVICVIEKQTRAAGSALVLFLQFSILLRYIRWVDHSGEEVVLTLFSNPTDIISLTKQHVIIPFLEGETDGAQGGNRLTTLRDHIQDEIKCSVCRKIPLKILFFRNFSYFKAII